MSVCAGTGAEMGRRGARLVSQKVIQSVTTVSDIIIPGLTLLRLAFKQAQQQPPANLIQFLLLFPTHVCLPPPPSPSLSRKSRVSNVTTTGRGEKREIREVPVYLNGRAKIPKQDIRCPGYTSREGIQRPVRG